MDFQMTLPNLDFYLPVFKIEPLAWPMKALSQNTGQCNLSAPVSSLINLFIVFEAFMTCVDNQAAVMLKIAGQPVLTGIISFRLAKNMKY